MAARLDYTPSSGSSANVIAATNAVPAAAILSMLVETRIPEAFKEAYNFEAYNFARLIAVASFLAVFSLRKLG